MIRRWWNGNLPDRPQCLASMEVNEIFFWFAVIVGGMVAPAVLAWGVVRLIRRRRNRRRHDGR